MFYFELILQKLALLPFDILYVNGINVLDSLPPTVILTIYKS